MRVGIFGIGLAAYWPQFEGLKERLEGYQRGIEERLRSSAPRSSRPGSWTRRSAPAQAGDDARRGPGRAGARSTRRRTRRRRRCCRPSRPPGRRW